MLKAVGVTINGNIVSWNVRVCGCNATTPQPRENAFRRVSDHRARRAGRNGPPDIHNKGDRGHTRSRKTPASKKRRGPFRARARCPRPLARGGRGWHVYKRQYRPRVGLRDERCWHVVTGRARYVKRAGSWEQQPVGMCRQNRLRPTFSARARPCGAAVPTPPRRVYRYDYTAED